MGKIKRKRGLRHGPVQMPDGITYDRMIWFCVNTIVRYGIADPAVVANMPGMRLLALKRDFAVLYGTLRDMDPADKEACRFAKETACAISDRIPEEAVRYIDAGKPDLTDPDTLDCDTADPRKRAETLMRAMTVINNSNMIDAVHFAVSKNRHAETAIVPYLREHVFDALSGRPLRPQMIRRVLELAAAGRSMLTPDERDGMIGDLWDDFMHVPKAYKNIHAFNGLADLLTGCMLRETFDTVRKILDERGWCVNAIYDAKSAVDYQLKNI